MFSSRRNSGHLEDAGPQLPPVLVPAISGLLETIARNTPAYDPRGEEFRRSIENLKVQVEQAEDAEVLVERLQAAAQAMEEHSAAFSRFLVSRRCELKSILTLLLESVLRNAPEDSAAPGELQTLVEEFEKSLEDDTIPALKVRIATALEALSVQAPQVEVAVQAYDPAQHPVFAKAGAAGLDAVTGLPSGERARESIGLALKSRRPFYLALFAVERLEIVNSRYGFGAGDQMLLLLSQHVAQQLSAGDQLYRWRGPTILALLQRDQPRRMVEAEVLRIASSRLEYTMDSRDRDVMLRIICSHCLFPLPPEAKVDSIVDRIDALSSDRTQAAWR